MVDPIDWAALAAPFSEDEIKERPGRGSMTFRYVDARAVAQRLDDVVTPSGWQFECAVIPGSDIVKGRLTIYCPGALVREDHGYPNSDRDEEPIKAATSDALKRCGVLFGIGRHLYEDNRPSHQNGHAPRLLPPQPPPAAAPSSGRSTTALPESLDDLDFESLSPVRPGAEAVAPPRSAGTMWSKELFERAEAASIDKKQISDTAKKMFGQSRWKVTDLEDGERFALAVELGLA
jgi:hypothetical protein